MRLLLTTLMLLMLGGCSAMMLGGGKTYPAANDCPEDQTRTEEGCRG